MDQIMHKCFMSKRDSNAMYEVLHYDLFREKYGCRDLRKKNTKFYSKVELERDFFEIPTLLASSEALKAKLKKVKLELLKQELWILKLDNNIAIAKMGLLNKKKAGLPSTKKYLSKENAWGQPEGLQKLERWAEEESTMAALCKRVGITPSTLIIWRRNNIKIDEAIRRGLEKSPNVAASRHRPSMWTEEKMLKKVEKYASETRTNQELADKMGVSKSTVDRLRREAPVFKEAYERGVAIRKDEQPKRILDKRYTVEYWEKPENLERIRDVIVETSNLKEAVKSLRLSIATFARLRKASKLMDDAVRAAFDIKVHEYDGETKGQYTPKKMYAYWLEPENLKRLTDWNAEGLAQNEISKRVGVAPGTLTNWAKRFPELKEAVDKGREVAFETGRNKLWLEAWLRPENLEIIKVYSSESADSSELAGKMGVTRTVVDTWKGKYPEFKEAVEEGKRLAEAEPEPEPEPIVEELIIEEPIVEETEEVEEPEEIKLEKRSYKNKEWITPEGLEKVTELFASGKSKGAVAYQMGVSGTSLTQWVNKYPEFKEAMEKGIKLYEKAVENDFDNIEITFDGDKPNYIRKWLTPVGLNEIARLAKECQNIDELADKMNMNRYTLKDWRAKHQEIKDAMNENPLFFNNAYTEVQVQIWRNPDKHDELRKLSTESQTDKELASKMGVEYGTLKFWKRKEPEIKRAIEEGAKLRVRTSARGEKYEYWSSPEGIKKLEGLKVEGKTMGEIAMQMGVAAQTLKNWRRDNPAIQEAVGDIRPRTTNKVEYWRSSEGLEIIEALATKSKTYLELAEEIGVNVNTLKGWVQKFPEVGEVITNNLDSATVHKNRPYAKWKNRIEEISDLASQCDTHEQLAELMDVKTGTFKSWIRTYPDIKKAVKVGRAKRFNDDGTFNPPYSSANQWLRDEGRKKLSEWTETATTMAELAVLMDVPLNTLRDWRKRYSAIKEITQPVIERKAVKARLEIESKPKAKDEVKEWLTFEGLEKIEKASSESKNYVEIAKRLGVSVNWLKMWRKDNPAIDDAIKRGRAKRSIENQRTAPSEDTMRWLTPEGLKQIEEFSAASDTDVELAVKMEVGSVRFKYLKGKYPEILSAVEAGEKRREKAFRKPEPGKKETWLLPENLKKLEDWASEGITNKDLAVKMEVTSSSLSNWKKRDVTIAAAIKRGRERVNVE